MSIVIGADIVPAESNQALFAQGNAKQLIGSELYEIMQNADYRIFNLEVPLANQPNPIAKLGPNLIAPTESINGLKAMGVDLLTLANNHIMDQGIQGLSSTLQTLDQAEISHLGTGNNLLEATAPFFFTVKGKRYGVYACAEHEFSIAGEDTPGANPFDSLESPDHVAQMKTQCDYAIVLYHGGKEYYRYPSPKLQNVCRKLVEKGADLVICQHSHCIGCEEKYLGGTIVYGQGNFLFDHGNNEYWNTSLLIRIKDSGKVDYIPLSKKGNCVRLAKDNEEKQILDAFRERSQEILTPGVVESNYKDFAKKTIDNYILALSGKSVNLPFRVINKLSGHRLQKKMAEQYRRKLNVQIRNYIECEAHRELVIKGLED